MQPRIPSQSAAAAHATRPDDFSREIYGVLGIPVEVTDMTAVVRRIMLAAGTPAPFLISTANLNFLVNSRSDAEFRESLLLSDLCTADGMPIVWLARLLGLPIKDRIAGSDIFEALKAAQSAERPLKVFLFGGAEGAGAAACRKLNAEPSGMTCAGFYEPGFGRVEEMSTDAIIDTINASGANFLAAALGAKKGQAWLLQNHDRLRVPVRVHLGATINFQAGTVRRAPLRLQKFGLEWLWRIKEEPKLWKRYWADGLVLLELLVTKVGPLLLLNFWHRFRCRRDGQILSIEREEDHKSVILSINGDATGRNVGNAVSSFRDAAATGKQFVINCTDTRMVDARFLGLLLMLRKRLKGQRLELTFTGVSPQLAKIFHLNGFGFLLNR